MLDQRPADGDALTLPARELRRLAVEQRLDLQELGSPGDALFDFVRASSFWDDEAELEVPPHRLGRVKRVGLEHHGQAPILGIEIGHIAPADRDAPVGDVEQPSQQVEQRGLSATGRAEQHQEIAVVDGQVEIVQNRHRAVGLDDVLEAHAWHGLTLDRAGSDALHEELAEKEVDDEGGNGGQQRRRHVFVVANSPVVVMTTLARITVIGCVPSPPKVRPIRKSFQIEVICRISTTIRILADIGRMISTKMLQNEPESIIAALMISCGMSL